MMVDIIPGVNNSRDFLCPFAPINFLKFFVSVEMRKIFIISVEMRMCPNCLPLRLRRREAPRVVRIACQCYALSY